MKHLVCLAALSLALTGCTTVTRVTEGISDRIGLSRTAAADEDVGAPSDPFVDTPPAVGESTLPPATTAAPPATTARTAEALDTTTPEQRAAAAAAPVAGAQTVLGTTVASLGAATEPGLWMKTPLVKTESQGRVTNPATGQSSAVTLIPLDGPATAGSQLSLAAMRLIGASLTDLTEVQVALEG